MSAPTIDAALRDIYLEPSLDGWFKVISLWWPLACLLALAFVYVKPIFIEWASNKVAFEVTGQDATETARLGKAHAFAKSIMRPGLTHVIDFTLLQACVLFIDTLSDYQWPTQYAAGSNRTWAMRAVERTLLLVYYIAASGFFYGVQAGFIWRREAVFGRVVAFVIYMWATAAYYLLTGPALDFALSHIDAGVLVFMVGLNSLNPLSFRPWRLIRWTAFAIYATAAPLGVAKLWVTLRKTLNANASTRAAEPVARVGGGGGEGAQSPTAAGGRQQQVDVAPASQQQQAQPEFFLDWISTATMIAINAVFVVYASRWGAELSMELALFGHANRQCHVPPAVLRPLLESYFEATASQSGLAGIVAWLVDAVVASWGWVGALFAPVVMVPTVRGLEHVVAAVTATAATSASDAASSDAVASAVYAAGSAVLANASTVAVAVTGAVPAALAEAFNATMPAASVDAVPDAVHATALPASVQQELQLLFTSPPPVVGLSAIVVLGCCGFILGCCVWPVFRTYHGVFDLISRKAVLLSHNWAQGFLHPEGTPMRNLRVRLPSYVRGIRHYLRELAASPVWRQWIPWARKKRVVAPAGGAAGAASAGGRSRSDSDGSASVASSGRDTYDSLGETDTDTDVDGDGNGGRAARTPRASFDSRQQAQAGAASAPAAGGGAPHVPPPEQSFDEWLTNYVLSIIGVVYNAHEASNCIQVAAGVRSINIHLRTALAVAQNRDRVLDLSGVQLRLVSYTKRHFMNAIPLPQFMWQRRPLVSITLDHDRQWPQEEGAMTTRIVISIRIYTAALCRALRRFEISTPAVPPSLHASLLWRDMLARAVIRRQERRKQNLPADDPVPDVPVDGADGSRDGGGLDDGLVPRDLGATLKDLHAMKGAGDAARGAGAASARRGHQYQPQYQQPEPRFDEPRDDCSVAAEDEDRDAFVVDADDLIAVDIRVAAAQAAEQARVAARAQQQARPDNTPGGANRYSPAAAAAALDAQSGRWWLTARIEDVVRSLVGGRPLVQPTQAGGVAATVAAAASGAAATVGAAASTAAGALTSTTSSGERTLAPWLQSISAAVTAFHYGANMQFSESMAAAQHSVAVFIEGTFGSLAGPEPVEAPAARAWIDKVTGILRLPIDIVLCRCFRARVRATGSQPGVISRMLNVRVYDVLRGLFRGTGGAAGGARRTLLGAYTGPHVELQLGLTRKVEHQTPSGPVVVDDVKVVVPRLMVFTAFGRDGLLLQESILRQGLRDGLREVETARFGLMAKAITSSAAARDKLLGEHVQRWREAQAVLARAEVALATALADAARRSAAVATQHGHGVDGGAAVAAAAGAASTPVAPVATGSTACRASLPAGMTAKPGDLSRRALGALYVLADLPGTFHDSATTLLDDLAAQRASTVAAGAAGVAGDAEEDRHLLQSMLQRVRAARSAGGGTHSWRELMRQFLPGYEQLPPLYELESALHAESRKLHQLQKQTAARTLAAQAEAASAAFASAGVAPAEPDAPQGARGSMPVDAATPFVPHSRVSFAAFGSPGQSLFDGRGVVERTIQEAVYPAISRLVQSVADAQQAVRRRAKELRKWLRRHTVFSLYASALLQQFAQQYVTDTAKARADAAAAQTSADSAMSVAMGALLAELGVPTAGDESIFDAPGEEAESDDDDDDGSDDDDAGDDEDEYDSQRRQLDAGGDDNGRGAAARGEPTPVEELTVAEMCVRLLTAATAFATAATTVEVDAAEDDA